MAMFITVGMLSINTALPWLIQLENQLQRYTNDKPKTQNNG